MEKNEPIKVELDTGYFDDASEKVNSFRSNFKHLIVTLPAIKQTPELAAIASGILEQLEQLSDKIDQY